MKNPALLNWLRAPTPQGTVNAVIFSNVRGRRQPQEGQGPRQAPPPSAGGPPKEVIDLMGQQMKEGLKAQSQMD